MKHWIINVLIAIDQLANAVCGGGCTSTISARVGYFSRVSNSKYKSFWMFIERIINITFAPIDGPDHCYDTYVKEGQKKYNEGNDFARALLAIIAVCACVFLAVAIRIIALFLKREDD